MVDNIDNWIVLGPGRTGSLAITRSLYALYDYKDFIYVNPTVWPRKIEVGEIVQTHRTDWLNYATDRTQVIISTRDPVDSTLSWFLKYDITKQWHFYANDEADIRKYINVCKSTKKVHIDPDKFIVKYKEALDIYARIELKPSYKIIDYDDWCDDSNLILTKLGYSNIKVHPKALILKNPGPHSKWISNWDELSAVLETLDRKIVFKNS